MIECVLIVDANKTVAWEKCFWEEEEDDKMALRKMLKKKCMEKFKDEGKRYFGTSGTYLLYGLVDLLGFSIGIGADRQTSNNVKIFKLLDDISKCLQSGNRLFTDIGSLCESEVSTMVLEHNMNSIERLCVNSEKGDCKKNPRMARTGRSIDLTNQVRLSCLYLTDSFLSDVIILDEQENNGTMNDHAKFRVAIFMLGSICLMSLTISGFALRAAYSY